MLTGNVQVEADTAGGDLGGTVWCGVKRLWIRKHLMFAPGRTQPLMTDRFRPRLCKNVFSVRQVLKTGLAVALLCEIHICWRANKFQI